MIKYIDEHNIFKKNYKLINRTKLNRIKLVKLIHF